MADQVDVLGAAGVDQCAHVVHQLRHPILPTAPGARSRRVTTLVGSQASVTAHGDSRNHLLPCGIRLRMAMKQHDYRPVGGTAVANIEDEVSAPKLLHQ